MGHSVQICKICMKRVVFQRVLCRILALALILHGKNQELSRGKSFHYNLVHRIVNHGKNYTVKQAVVSMAHESLTQGPV